MLSTHFSQEVEEPPNGPRPSDLAAGGDAATLERVPEETLRVIDQLFPRPTSGIAFLALLLRWANVRQYAHGLGETHDVAVIRVQSIRVLARLIGWSYETTHKYIVLFCALGLLTKYREDGMVALHFDLYRYDPPRDLTKLDELIADARHKVAVCARRVKQRYLVLYSQHAPSVSSPPLLPSTGVSTSYEATAPLTELDATIYQVRELLRENGTEAFRPQLGEVLVHLLHLRGLLALPVPQDRGDSSRLLDQQSEPSPSSIVSMATRKPTPSEHLVDPSNGTASDERRLSTHQVDSISASLPCCDESGRLFPQRVDFDSVDAAGASRLSPHQVDSDTSTHESQGRLEQKKSTLTTRFETQNGRLSSRRGDTPPRTVDSDSNLNKSTPPNVNVSIQTVIDSLNVNVRGVAAYLQEAFGEEMQKRGYYHNLYRNHKDVRVWLAAALETLVGVHQARTIRQPGKYFYDRCVVLHRDGIPPELDALIHQYGSLSLEQLVATLCKREPVSKSTSSSSSHTSRSGAVPVPKSPDAPVLHIPRERDHVGMSQQDAKQVYHLVTAAIPGFQLRAYRQADASYAMLIDDGLRHPHQTWMYSLHECQERLARMKKVRDLFQTTELMNT